MKVRYEHLKRLLKTIASDPRFILGAVLAALLIAGFVVWLPTRNDPGSQASLGAQVVGGTIVAGALAAAVLIIERRHVDQLEADRLRLHLTSEPHLRGVNLAGKDISGILFADKDLSNAVLAAVNARDIQIRNCLLAEANLREADLSDGIVTDSRFVNVVGVDTYLPALFRGAQLARTMWFKCDLRYAEMEMANLRGARFHDCDLRGADLHGADLELAAFNLGTNLEGARADASTRWPAGFDPGAHGVIVE